MTTRRKRRKKNRTRRKEGRGGFKTKEQRNATKE